MQSLPFIAWCLRHLNYWVITLLMAIESSFIPFPSEVVVPPAAYLAASGSQLNVFLVVLCATIGALIGAIVNYALARYLGRPIIYRFANSRLGHICLIRLTEEHNPNVRIGLTPLPAIIVGMKVEGKEFQISFRGMSEEVLESIDKAGARHDMAFSGYYLQPIATALYQYSYLLRWKGIKN